MVSSSSPPPEGPECAELRYFTAIPSCAAILSDPSTTVWQPPRTTVSHPAQDGLFAKILNNPGAIPALVTFYYQKPRQQELTSGSSLTTTSAPASDPTTTITSSAADELRALIALGPSISGFPGVAHGGLVTAVLDEILGLTIALLRERGVIHGAWLTAWLHTAFLRPVRIPRAAVLVVARVVQRDERKIRLVAVMRDVEGGKDGEEGKGDRKGEGVELARAEALFVKVKEGRL